jgi:hypothetical protein
MNFSNNNNHLLKDGDDAKCRCNPIAEVFEHSHHKQRQKIPYQSSIAMKLG